MGTKGTWRRPAAISDAELDRRWAEAFGAGQPQEIPCCEPDCVKTGPHIVHRFIIDEPPTNH